MQFKESENWGEHLKPLDVNDVTDESALSLIVEMLRLYIKDYKKAVKRGHKLTAWGFNTLESNRAVLKSPFVLFILELINVTPDEIIKEVGDDREAVYAQDTTTEKKDKTTVRTNRKRQNSGSRRNRHKV